MMRVRKGFIKDYLFIDQETKEEIDIGYRIPVNVLAYVQFNDFGRINRWFTIEAYPYYNKIGEK